MRHKLTALWPVGYPEVSSEWDDDWGNAGNLGGNTYYPTATGNYGASDHYGNNQQEYAHHDYLLYPDNSDTMVEGVSNRHRSGVDATSYNHTSNSQLFDYDTANTGYDSSAMDEPLHEATATAYGDSYDPRL